MVRHVLFYFTEIHLKTLISCHISFRTLHRQIQPFTEYHTPCTCGTYVMMATCPANRPLGHAPVVLFGVLRLLNTSAAGFKWFTIADTRDAMMMNSSNLLIGLGARCIWINMGFRVFEKIRWIFYVTHGFIHIAHWRHTRSNPTQSYSSIAGYARI